MMCYKRGTPVRGSRDSGVSPWEPTMVRPVPGLKGVAKEA